MTVIEELKKEYKKEIEALKGDESLTVDVDLYECKYCGELFYKDDLKIDGENPYTLDINGNVEYGYQTSWEVCPNCDGSNFFRISEITFYEGGEYDY